MTNVVANVVGRNEAGKYLKPVLDRLKEQVDLIVFTDDCSDDDTPQIAKDAGAQVFSMDKPTFRTNEGLLRQQSWVNLESVIPSKDCFILAIDCDEMLFETKYTLHQLADQSNFDVINVQFFHMWNDTHFRIDKAWRPHPSSRYFRYYENGKFADRALACGSEPTYIQPLIRQGKYLMDSGLLMQHLSYIEDKDKKEKYERYMAIDGGAYHANAHIISIMDEEPELREWMWE